MGLPQAVEARYKPAVQKKSLDSIYHECERRSPPFMGKDEEMVNECAPKYVGFERKK